MAEEGNEGTLECGSYAAALSPLIISIYHACAGRHLGFQYICQDATIRRFLPPQE